MLTPQSSIEDPTDIGRRAHTHLRVFLPTGGMDGVTPPSTAAIRRAQPNAGEGPAGYFYLETPASLACVYRLVSNLVTGCSPYATSTNPSGGSRAIAIVDAYDDPTAAADVAAFSTRFGLPAASLQVVYATGTQPSPNYGWQLEEALDVQWAHAMAPHATIYLVEAASSNLDDLLTAVGVADTLVTAAGGGEVSMSWGTSEYAGETSLDTNFTTPGVVYVASAGDSPGVEYPSASPNVVAAGGTAVSRNPETGNFQLELAWQSTGGGSSAFEPQPSYQNGIGSVGGTVARGIPDVSAVADPTTGVWVYLNGSWLIVGGTSVAAPVWAGIINAAGRFSQSGAAELNLIYGSTLGYTKIKNGDCGAYEGYIAIAPWNFCTGHGSPNGLAAK